MDFEQAKRFLERHHDAVVVTHRKNGAAQASVVMAGAYNGGVVLVAIGNTAKLKNLRRDPRCSITVVSKDWSQWVTVEGKAEIKDWDNTDHEALRRELREAFRACGGGEHPDWEEYDRVMKQDQRAIVLIRPGHSYGLFR